MLDVGFQPSVLMRLVDADCHRQKAQSLGVPLAPGRRRQTTVIRDKTRRSGSVERGSTNLQILCAAFATLWIDLDFVGDLLPLRQARQSGALDGAHMDEHVVAAVVGLDKSKTLLTVEPLHRTSRHDHPFCFPAAVRAAGRFPACWLLRASCRYKSRGRRPPYRGRI